MYASVLDVKQRQTQMCVNEGDTMPPRRSGSQQELPGGCLDPECERPRAGNSSLKNSRPGYAAQLPAEEEPTRGVTDTHTQRPTRACGRNTPPSQERDPQGNLETSFKPVNIYSTKSTLHILQGVRLNVTILYPKFSEPGTTRPPPHCRGP